jgi:hypothetical protein
MCSVGELEPAFKVLFSAIFHGASLGNAIRVEPMESSGSKSLVVFGQPAYIFYVRFNHFLPTFRGCQYKAVLIQGAVICGANSARPECLSASQPDAYSSIVASIAGCLSRREA